MEAFMGTVMATAIGYAPRGWMLCQGQTLSIAQNSALFSLLGTTYGGNGQTTFNLPNLCGRMPIGTGPAPGVTTRTLGEIGGNESFSATATVAGQATIGVANLPSHTHTASAALTATTTVKTGTTGTGVAVPVEGAGLVASPGGPGAAAIYASPAPTTGTVNLGNVSTAVAGSVDATGSGTPLPISATGQVMTATMSPFLALNFIICVEGIYPTRN